MLATPDNTEDLLIEELDNKRLYDFFMPAIKAVIASGGGADAIMKKSEVMAAIRLAEIAAAGSEANALHASKEILNRSLGKPVERHLSIHAEIAGLTEEQLDQQILLLAKKAGAEEVVQMIARPKASTKRTRRGKAHQSIHVSDDSQSK